MPMPCLDLPKRIPQVATVTAEETPQSVPDENSKIIEYQSEDHYFVALILFLESETLPSDPVLSKKILSEKS